MRRPSKRIVRGAVSLAFALLALVSISISCAAPATPSAPVPLLKARHPVDWWFVFKFNAANFPGCSGTATRACQFGGEVQQYEAFGQQFVYASSEDAALKDGADCLGDTTTDPVGATFNEVYNGAFNYVVWNDQFYDDPEIEGCTQSCFSPWGHSKGMLAWDADGDGLVMQVSTPSWPGAGNRSSPRKTDGNTLGCVRDNNVQVSQHFFALRLTKDDVVKVLTALSNASIVTDPTNPQLVRNGGPADIQQLVGTLDKQSPSHDYIAATLSSGVELISKPSDLRVPPWQMVSAILGGTSLRAATWWADPEINSTTASSIVRCWDTSLGKPGAVEIATTGHWEGKTLGLSGGLGTNFNHAKIGVTTSGPDAEAIFGDMNQQGTLSPPDCGSSQNGRGGLFYVVKDQKLHDAIAQLISGESAPTQDRATQTSPGSD
jgi:Deoxyribonuclease II